MEDLRQSMEEKADIIWKGEGLEQGEGQNDNWMMENQKLLAAVSL